MNVRFLSLRNFRSYERQELEFTAGLVAVIGPNGSGKTNLLEALHLAVQGFPLRTRRDATVIRFGCDAARVEARGFRAGGVAFSATATVGRQQGKQLELDHGGAVSVDDLRRELCALAFTPDRLAVIKGGPLVRRLYLDRMLGRLNPARAAVSTGFARVLAQRNAALRRVKAGISSRDALTPWSATLVQLGCDLNAARVDAVVVLGPPFEEIAQSLGLAGCRILYAPPEISEAILDARLARDLERGTTGAGPHLADLAIERNNRDLRSFGSQGEQRLAVLALLLAEAHVLAAQRHDPPLLLLDDVLSELDDSRKQALLTSVPAGSQTIVTSTTLQSFPSAGCQLDQVVDVLPEQARSR